MTELFVNPSTGEVVYTATTDGLIDALEQIRALETQLAADKSRIVQRLVEMTTADGIDTKTRRIRGVKRRAKITMPSSWWDQKMIRQAWEDFPSLRDQALKIDKIGVRLREFDKLKNESGPEEFRAFVELLRSAERESTSLPSVTIEE